MQAGSQRNTQRGWWLLITIHALLLPLYGPLLDHHFAERLPYHNHLYLSAEPTHHHLHNVPHSHHHEPDSAPHLPPTGVISLPTQELANQNPLLLSLFMGALTAGIEQPFVALHVIGLVDGGLRPVHTIFLPRPEEPPRLPAYYPL